jgi:cobalt/nickel transport system permease protein
VAGIAAWLSVMAGALATALQLWLSGTSDLQAVVFAMLGVHALIGVGEVLITVAALTFILQTRPDLLEAGSATAPSGRGWVVVGVLVSLAVVLLSPLASANPDGLERVAIDMGFIESGQSAPYEILPDYTIPFLGETPLSTILAGVAGVLVVLGLVYLAGRSLQKRKSQTESR